MTTTPEPTKAGQCVGGPFHGMVPKRWDTWRSYNFGNNHSRFGDMDVLPSDKIGTYTWNGRFWIWGDERPSDPFTEERMVQS